MKVEDGADLIVELSWLPKMRKQLWHRALRVLKVELERSCPDHLEELYIELRRCHSEGRSGSSRLYDF